LGDPFALFDEMGNPIPGDFELRFNAADFQPWVSSISFRCNYPWFFDATPQDASDVPDGLDDFLSTAVHEIGHGLGIAENVPAFVAYIDAQRNYVGAEATTHASGPIPLTEDGHLATDGFTMSTSGGTRFPSEMEFGILTDIGYEVVADY